MVCNELAEVAHKAHLIGIQLGVPHHKIAMFKKEEDDILSAVINYWLCGNVLDVPVTWNSIIAALESKHVGEPGFAARIREKYCGQQKGKLMPPQ